MPPLIEVRSANERGNSSELVAEFAGGGGAVDHGPVDHQLLRAEARPLDEAERDALVRAGLDRVDHARVGDRRRIAFALQLEFRVIDAARDVGGEHQQEVDLLRGRRERGPDQDERCQRQHASNEPDHNCLPDVATDGRQRSRFRLIQA